MRRIQENARARSALVPLSLAAVLGLGCSGEFPAADITSESTPANDAVESSPSNDAAESALIEAYLAGRGFDTSNLQFEGDEVIVEGGMVVQRAVLLDVANAEASGVVEKGYFHPASSTLYPGKSITLTFVGVSSAWQTAFRDAAREWNRRVPRFSQPGPANAAPLTVQMGVDGQAVGSPAKAGFPPNRNIFINPNFRSNACAGQTIETVSATVKLATALHEMGHSLGFEHPRNRAPDTVHIAGTAQNTVPESSSCSGTGCVSYSTVMLPRGCSATLTALQPDDILSATKKYPSCRTVCETNCLSQIDPGAIGLCIASCPQQCGE